MATQQQDQDQPRFSPQFEELAAQHIGLAVHQSLLFADTVSPAEWRYDIEASTFTVAERTFAMSPLGTTIPGPNVFAWCWADSSLERWPQSFAASWKLRMLGYDKDIPEFTTGGVPIGGWSDLDEAAKRLTLVALGVLGGRGSHGFRMNHGGGFHVLTDDPTLPVAAEPEPDLVKRVLELCAEYFPHVDQMEIAADYVEALGGRWSQIPGGLTVGFPTGGMSLHFAGNRVRWIGPGMG